MKEFPPRLSKVHWKCGYRYLLLLFHFICSCRTHFKTHFHVWLIKITLYNFSSCCLPTRDNMLSSEQKQLAIAAVNYVLLLFIVPSNRKYDNIVASLMQVCTGGLVSDWASCQQQCSLKATVISTGRCKAVAPLEANIHFDENNCITLTQVKAMVTATKTSLRSCACTKVYKNVLDLWNLMPPAIHC